MKANCLDCGKRASADYGRPESCSVKFKSVVASLFAAAALYPVASFADEVKTLPTDTESLPKIQQLFVRGITPEIKSFAAVKDDPGAVSLEVALSGEGSLQYLIPFQTEIVQGNSYRLTYKAKIGGLPNGCKIQLGYFGKYFPDRNSPRDNGFEQYPKPSDSGTPEWIQIEDTITVEKLLTLLGKTLTPDELAKGKIEVSSLLITVIGPCDGKVLSVTLKDVKIETKTQK
ncbi:MAG: hypothetical protein NT118_00920 [Lentisphaerae bacterium]|nr:hypothetical protein [Lentisphaerota bacterium]